MEKNILKEVQDHFNDLNFDIKAETFAAGITEFSEVTYSYSDYFQRRYSPDVSGIREDDVYKENVVVHLSRRGFYNIFPERFFHKTVGSTGFVNEMVNAYKNRKVEQEKAQSFFSPLEEEFFLHRVEVEREEDRIFESLGNSELVYFLSDLWEINANIPHEMAGKILKSIPFMHKIAGNLTLIQQVLETITQENLTITKTYTTIPNTHEHNDTLQLGVNLATATSGASYLPKYTFTINNIKKPENIYDYLPQGKIILVMNYFLDHTMPFESDFEIDFTLPQKKQNFTLSDSIFAGRLGISSTI
ncbi:hypothetical protein Celal_3746 [Cellulophaga algicola DSM 14237]|uniref:Uncharacterized protein n=1 Tax=Cellulophaga algicola (strain DSM 14237 / IC166 / ACAM 630) TaxID=688270 RepID=E6XAN3_CELAD|nr:MULTISPECIES: hypothetical protein [Cellulophaga]ADV50995.1 hypothetical protein Celal_3746 [Cellulophaga algicola DSM 14237]